MERNTQTTVRTLEIGDRFYKATDKKKTVLEMIKHDPKTTKHQTYNYWCKGDTDRHPQAIQGGTLVIFLRNKNEQKA